MEKKEIKKEMKNILKRNKYKDPTFGDYDPEYAHIEADELLCKVLMDEGYDELVEWFKSLEKWYS